MGLFGPEKITLMLEKSEYKPGDAIKGTVTLKLKKPTMARKLEVTFIGERIERHRDRDAHGHSHTHTVHVPIYDFKIQLDGEKEYFEGAYPFEIKIPPDLVKFTIPIDPEKEAKQKLESEGINTDGKIGKALVFMQTHQTLSSIVKKTPTTPTTPPLIWNITAHLDIPKGLDIRESKQIILSFENTQNISGDNNRT